MAEVRSLPDLVVKQLDYLDVSEPERQVEIAAYWKIVELVDATTEPFTKRVHLQTMEHILDRCPMKFSYCLENVFPQAVKDQREAAKTIRPFGLFAAIERIMAGATHTSNFGDSSRWPLHTSGTYSKSKKLPRNGALGDLALPKDILGSYYQFGVHTFRVGRVVHDIMRMIEQRYGLDFEALEKARKAK